MVYWISYYFFKIIIKVFFRGKCYNRENLPQKGPYIAIINHNSIFDIPTMSLAVKGRVSTMVKNSLFEVPILRWWLKAVGMFPVERDRGDTQSFEHALSLLKQGWVLYMAPEGTRKYDPNNPPRARTGFVRLAQLAGCPVVPIAISGTREVLPPGAKFPRFVKVRANVGKQIRFEKTDVDLNNRDKLQEQATRAMNKIYELREELLSKYN